MGVVNNANGPRAYHRLFIWRNELGTLGERLSGLGISTDYFVFNDQGDKTRHVSTIRLEAAGSTDPKTGQLTDRADICASGPFYPGRQLDLTLRTLFPVFSCKTRIDKGEIVIKAERKADDSGVDMWAECYNIDGTKTTKPEAIKNTP